MAVITLPDAVAASVAGQGYGQARFDLADVSDVTGGAFTMPQSPPRWVASLRSKQALPLAAAGEWEATLLRLRGGINHLAVWDLLRPAPLGSMRGTMTLGSSAAIGATSLTLAGVTNAVPNLVKLPYRLDNAVWSGVAAYTPNTHAAPDGTTTAGTLTDSSGSVTENRTQAMTVPVDSATYRYQLFVRKTSGGTQPTLILAFSLTGGTVASNNVRFNSDTGAVLLGTATVVSDGSYWRVSAPLANNGTNSTLTFGLSPAGAAYGLITADVTQTGSAVVWGLQVEVAAESTQFSGLPFALPGEWLQVGTGVGTSQLVKVVAAATASDTGAMTVTVEPPLRYAFSSGAAVIWDKPVAYYKLTNSALSWAARANGPAIDGFSVDLMEQWA